MPTTTQQPIQDPLDSETFQQAWVAFVKAVERVRAQKALQPNRQYVQENYSTFANNTAKILIEDEYSSEITSNWSDLASDDRERRGAELLLEEIRNYPTLAETVLQKSQTETTPGKSSYSLKDALSIAKTIIDSIVELLNLSAWGKLFIKLYGEAIDIFKGG